MDTMASDASAQHPSWYHDETPDGAPRPSSSAHDGAGPPIANDLDSWIAELRARLDRGDLATVAPVDIGQGTHVMPAEHLIRVMLADLDSYADMTAAEANDPVNVARRVGLIGDFRLLRILIG